MTGGLEGLKETRFVSQYTLVYYDKKELGMRLGLCRDTTSQACYTARHSACYTVPASTTRPAGGATTQPRARPWALLCAPGRACAHLGAPVRTWALLCAPGRACAHLGALVRTWARLCCNAPKYTLVVFDMFKVFCKHNLNVS